MKVRSLLRGHALLAALMCTPLLASAQNAILQITLQVDPADRPAAVAVYTQYKQPFLTRVPGAQAKELLARDADVQVLHRFETRQQAESYLSSDLFNKDVVFGLSPLLKAAPEVRIYTAN